MAAIDPDVLRIAKQFGVDPALVQAVVTAEGDILKAVQCTFPPKEDGTGVRTRTAAIEVVCRSCAHALNDYVRITDPAAFVTFWQKRWAPVGAKNDPSGLNGNWASNVRKIWAAGRQA